MQARGACILPAPVQEHNLLQSLPSLMHKGSLDLACSTCSVHECVLSLNGIHFFPLRSGLGRASSATALCGRRRATSMTRATQPGRT